MFRKLEIERFDAVDVDKLGFIGEFEFLNGIVFLHLFALYLTA